MSHRHPLLVVVVLTCSNLMTDRAAGELIARLIPPKPSTITKPPFESQLTVGFCAELKVRATGGDLTSAVGADLSNVSSVQTQYDLSFAQLIDVAQATLDFLENRAAQRSGVAQPDLAGMMSVDGPVATIENAANALLGLSEVEWVEFGMVDPDPPVVCQGDCGEGVCCDSGEQCCDVDPATCDFFAARGTVPTGIPEYAEILDYHGPDEGLDMTCAWVYGARGEGIEIADVEEGYMPEHEDLCNIGGDPVETIRNDSHGTAVLGILNALDNAYGWTGLAPEAAASSFTEHPIGLSVPNSASRITAITHAKESLAAGDVLLLELQTAREVSGTLPNIRPRRVSPTRLECDLPGHTSRDHCRRCRREFGLGFGPSSV